MSQHVFLENDENDLDDDRSLTIDEPAGGDGPTQPDPNAPPPASGAAEDVLTGDDIPEKYRGKSAAELLKIVRDQEEYLGRQGNELGQLRQQVGTLRGVVDQAISVQAGVQPSANEGEDDQLTADELLTNPKEAIGKAVKSYLRPIEQRFEGMSRQERQSAFLAAHPTAPQDVNDAKFVEWVKQSPYRTKLATKAFQDQNNPDYDAAEELWLGYEEVRGAAAQGTQTSQPAGGDTPPANAPSPKEVALLRSGGSGADPGGEDKVIYSAAKLTRLQMEKPDEYYEPSFYAKVAKAWSEGRVR